MNDEMPVALTGIKPTGDPHLGNYVGAIRPALSLAHAHRAVYFIADYHALNTINDPAVLRRYTRSVAATWIACGLDPASTLIYRQSHVPETFELSTILSSITPKGLMNRAHAYKAAVDRNAAESRDRDAGVNMGLYTYPILMAADILVMNADVVPVGKDQVQHVEIAADIAERFNHVYGSRFRFNVPRVSHEADEPSVMPGIDGRKMSKSYGNTIPLFGTSSELRKFCMRIVTDSTPLEAPKRTDGAPVMDILSKFATPSQLQEVTDSLQRGGTGWGAAKQLLFTLLNEQMSPMREEYLRLLDPGSELDDVLDDGARRARERAAVVLDGVRREIGVGRVGGVSGVGAQTRRF